MKKLAWTLSLAATMFWQVRAQACGCFTQPTVTTPVVQAGERILFAHDGNQVVAYIQIQYQGSADHFGWIVPLPSIPTLQLGTDELFTRLGAQTQPQYQLTTTRNFCGGGSVSSTSSPGVGCGGAEDDSASNAAFDLGFAAAADAAMQMNPVVVQSSIGPFDYAVLKADDQTEMQNWLNDNGYFVPDATGDAVKPYIHAGAYFLALKLQAGQSAGDIVPIILRYTSDLPMIPITLTSVGAVPNMGVLVWSLGQARAIPRNYYHSVLDELPVWLNGSAYQSLVTAAVKEAPGHHSFVTEYAGSSSIMSGQLYAPGRFGNLSTLRTITDPAAYIQYLQANGYTFDSTLYALLEQFLPEPAAAVADGVSESQFYGDYTFYSQFYGPGTVDGGAPPPSFDPSALTDLINMRIVQPTINTQTLFDDNPYLTRLFTTISPIDMNMDPVFSENPDLPDVSLLHTATLTYPCSGDPWLSTDQGFEIQYPGGFAPSVNLEPSLRLETLREEGAPTVITDNHDAIVTQAGPVSHGSNQAPSSSATTSSGGMGGCACDVSARARNQMGTGLMVLAAALFIRRRRRVQR